VDSVRPLYGPVSGGTRVTITGQLLTVSIVTAVYIGENSIRRVAGCSFQSNVPKIIDIKKLLTATAYRLSVTDTSSNVTKRRYPSSHSLMPV